VGNQQVTACPMLVNLIMWPQPTVVKMVTVAPRMVDRAAMVVMAAHPMVIKMAMVDRDPHEMVKVAADPHANKTASLFSNGGSNGLLSVTRP